MKYIAVDMLKTSSFSHIRFVKQHIHGGMPESIDVDALKKEVEELRQKNSDLESQVAQLQSEVCMSVIFKIIGD